MNEFEKGSWQWATLRMMRGLSVEDMYGDLWRVGCYGFEFRSGDEWTQATKSPGGYFHTGWRIPEREWTKCGLVEAYQHAGDGDKVRYVLGGSGVTVGTSGVLCWVPGLSHVLVTNASTATDAWEWRPKEGDDE
jgi:hypothetical protein